MSRDLKGQKDAEVGRPKEETRSDPFTCLHECDENFFRYSYLPEVPVVEFSGVYERLDVKAVFMDRDGIINELVYYPEHGVVDSPFTIEQFRLTSSAVQAINRFHELGYKVIVISNQPGIAKGHFDEATFDLIRLRMQDLLREGNVQLDGEYYCFHHPDAVREEYRKVCDCRKPGAGLILRAARDHNIILAKSFFIGDGLVDVKAGREAGCKTVLVASTNGFLLRLLKEEDVEPNYLVKTLGEAISTVENLTDPHDRTNTQIQGK